MTEILNTWKEVAAYLKISVGYAQELARRHPDFPVFRDNRIFTTKRALATWVEDKAGKLGAKSQGSGLKETSTGSRDGSQRGRGRLTKKIKQT
jgi:hypothetical protein